MTYKSKGRHEEKCTKLLIRLTVLLVEILIKELDGVFEDLLRFNDTDDKNLEHTNYIFSNIKVLRKDIPITSIKKDKIVKWSKTFDGKYIEVLYQE